MNKTKIGIFLSLFVAFLFSSCKEQQSNTRLLLNEVMLENESSWQDDYGNHSAWIEIFNKSFSNADLASCMLKVSNTPGDTIIYRIPKGDVLTLVKPRQHVLFYADSEPKRGTFHTNFFLNPDTANWIGLFDSGGKLLDQLMIPANVVEVDQSYGRVNDASANWEIKDGSTEKYVTPSTNNKTIDTNVKMDKFQDFDGTGLGMSLSAMSVVFCGLILLYILYKMSGAFAIRLSKRNAMKAKGVTCMKEAKETRLGESPGEIFAAIGLALHEMKDEVHDVENTILTITPVKRSYSPWSSKIYTLRETPRK
ncbi:MAG: OadG family transporter subunit [Phocaeicola sp.]